MNIVSKFVIPVLAAFLMAAMPLASHAAPEDDQYDVPYVPTPMKTVARMLEFEAALARAQATLGMIPPRAAAVCRNCRRRGRRLRRRT